MFLSKVFTYQWNSVGNWSSNALLVCFQKQCCRLLSYMPFSLKEVACVVLAFDMNVLRFRRTRIVLKFRLTIRCHAVSCEDLFALLLKLIQTYGWNRRNLSSLGSLSAFSLALISLLVSICLNMFQKLFLALLWAAEIAKIRYLLFNIGAYRHVSQKRKQLT